MDRKSLVFKFGEYEVSERELHVTRDGEELALEPKAFRVLLYLVRNPGRLVTKDDLLSAVWGDVSVQENSLTRAIAILRRVLDDDIREPQYIETVPKAGYRFKARVIASPDNDAFPVPFSGQNDQANPAAVPVGFRPEVAVPPAAIPSSPPETASRAARKTRWAWLFGTTVVLVLAGGYWYLSPPLPPPRITAYTQITHDGREKRIGGTDGSRVYFTQFSPNLIAQVGINGGEVAQVPISVPGINPLLMDISPDGSNALVTTLEPGLEGNPMWVVPILGGSAKRLGDGEGERFSPDGGSVIYSTLNGDIFLVHIDGSDRHKLASVGSDAGPFRWSPDGKVIRFSKQDGIWEMSANGTGIHRLFPDWKVGIPAGGEWTRDGGLFLFWASGEIWALDERRSLLRRPSSVPVQLTSGPVRWGGPLPGRDGKTIFARSIGPPKGELTRIDPKTGASKSFLDGISAEFVSFSPDGNSVAYVAYPEGTLWKANRDGSSRMQLTTPSLHEVVNPRWSPDSKQIVFMTLDPDGHSAIHRISSVDGSPQWLLSEDSADMHDPNWSPDGKKVVFGAGWVDLPSQKLELRIVDLETRQIKVVPGSEGKWQPRWSPDGRYISASANRSLVHPSVFDLKLQRWLDLTVNGQVWGPEFSHDSNFFYFVRQGMDQGIFRIPVIGGKEERVVDLRGWHLTGYFGCDLKLDPTGAPLVLRDAGSNDIYALTLEEN